MRRMHRMGSHQRRLIGGRHQHHRALAAFGTQRIVQEIADLTSAFADHGNHHDVSANVAGHHAEQGAFAHTAAGKHADALPLGQRQHTIDRPHPVSSASSSGARCMGLIGARWISRWLSAAMSGPPSSGTPNASITRPTIARQREPATRDQATNTRTHRHAAQMTKRHQQDTSFAKTHDFGASTLARDTCFDLAQFTDPGVGPIRLDHQPVEAQQTAIRMGERLARKQAAIAVK